jgi:hypothetical protein
MPGWFSPPPKVRSSMRASEVRILREQTYRWAKREELRRKVESLGGSALWLLFVGFIIELFR